MTYEEMLALLSQETSRVDITSVDQNKSFSDNKLDSLDVFAWIASIEETLDIEITSDDFIKITTPGDLHLLITEKIKG